MIIFASITRVLHSSSRTNATLLLCVSAKTLDNQGEGDDDDPYKNLHQYIGAEESDIIPSYDPRITYILDVDALIERSPVILEGVERQRQREPVSKRFTPNTLGHANMYRVNAVLEIDRVVAKVHTTATVAKLLPPHQRQLFVRACRINTLKNECPTLMDVDTALATARNVSQNQRWNVIDALSEMTSPLEYLEAATTVMSLGKPSSLRRLTGTELMSLTRFVDDMNELDYDAKKAIIPFRSMAVGRFADLLPIMLARTRRRLHSSILEQRRWSALANASAVDALVNAFRMFSSTVGTLQSDGGGGEAAVNIEDPDLVLKTLKEIGALVQVGVNDDGQALFSSGRDDELERESAAILRDETVARRIIAVSAAGNADAIYTDALRRRLDYYGLSNVMFVAPTVGHANSCPAFDCESVDDVLAGRVDWTRRPQAVCLVYAHAFGLDSFVHTIRAFACGRRRNPMDAVVLVGDPFAVTGSPRETDRGAPFRDICAAFRRHVLGDRGILDSLFGLSGAGPSGPLNTLDHERLRHRTTPELPSDDDTFTLVKTLNEIDASVREHGLIMVGTSSLVDALNTVGTFSDANVIRKFVAFDELGQVVRVKESVRSTFVSGISKVPFVTDNNPIVNYMPLHTRNGYIIIDTEHDTSGVDHRRCCFTERANVASLSMHVCIRSLAGTPARMLARIAPTPVADELAFVVTEKTGIEDFRAAFSMVRRRLHIVCGPDGISAVRSALNRHVPRPRTRLVDLLSSPAAEHYVPMPLLEWSGRHTISMAIHGDNGDHFSENEIRNAQQQNRERAAPFRLVTLGSIHTEALASQARGIKDGYAYIPLEKMNANFYDYLYNRHFAHGDDAADGDSDLEEVAPDEHVDDFSVFSPNHVDVTALASIHHRIVDENVKHRLWALVHAYRVGSLGDDLDGGDDELERLAASYPPPIDAQSVSHALSRSRAIRSREAAIVHIMCKIVKGVAETWYIEAERRLVKRRAIIAYPNEDEKNDSIARHHATAIRNHLNNITEPPPLEHAPEDVYNLFEKLHDLREYIRVHQQ